MRVGSFVLVCMDLERKPMNKFVATVDLNCTHSKKQNNILRSVSQYWEWINRVSSEISRLARFSALWLHSPIFSAAVIMKFKWDDSNDEIPIHNNWYRRQNHSICSHSKQMLTIPKCEYRPVNILNGIIKFIAYSTKPPQQGHGTFTAHMMWALGIQNSSIQYK